MDKYLSKKIKIISFFSIIMVVLIHSYNMKDDFLNADTKISDPFSITCFIEHFLSNGFTRVAVPFFFAISGYLFFVNFNPTIKGFLTKFKKRVNTLFIPHILWSSVIMLFFLVLQSIRPLYLDFTGGAVSSYSFGKVIYTLVYNPISYQLWFTRDLIIYVILTPIIYLAVSRLSYFAVAPFFIVWFLNINLVAVNNEGIFFFILGTFLAVKKKSWKREHNKLAVNILLASWIALLLVKTYMAFSSSFALLYMYKAAVILGMLSIWFAYDAYIGNVEENSRIFKFTPYTFFIFIFHVPLVDMLKVPLTSAFASSIPAHLIIFIFASSFSIGLAIIVGILLNTYITPVFNLITGGRGTAIFDKKITEVTRNL
ncbi:MAG: acyltransferase [Bacillota bacterium]|nr:acyltransferase [Bacillota bacterium]